MRREARFLHRNALMGRPGVYSYTHLSSVDYHPGLDIVAVLEGNALTLRNADGCIIHQHRASKFQYQWPHDMEVASDGHGGAHIYVAELHGNRMMKYTLGKPVW